MSDTAFVPEGDLTRGQFVTILYRLAGCPEVTRKACFRDVASGSYYENAVAWAVEQGYVLGTSADTFSPNLALTREMGAAILWRMAGYPTSKATLEGFTDCGSVSGYAREAMEWAFETGVVRGISSTVLAPQGNATRAQGVVMILRYDHLVIE